MYKSAILVILAAALPAALSAPAAKSYAEAFGYDYNPVPDIVSSQYHAQDELGQYNYGYSGPNSAKQEFKTADGVVRGSYSYIDANGILQKVDYISDILGFRSVATNLPTGEHAVPVAYSQATVNAVPVQQVIAEAHQPAIDVAAMAPSVGYSYLPYATNYGYYFNSGQPAPVIPATAPVQIQYYAPAAEVNSVPVIENQELAEPVILEAVVPVVTQTQYHAQDELGQYNFGYSDPNSERQETRTADGVVRGFYNYLDSDGHVQTVYYIADALGFRVAGTNVPVAVYDLPLDVSHSETPEVQAARAEHIAIYNTVKAEHEQLKHEIEERNHHDLHQSIGESHVNAEYAYAPAVEIPALPLPAALVEVREEIVPQHIDSFAPVAVVAPVGDVSSQFHVQDDLGQYNYGYSTAQSSKVESKTSDGVVRGAYNYIDPEGKLQTVQYISDVLGFRVAGTNLPVHVIPSSEPALAYAVEPEFGHHDAPGNYEVASEYVEAESEVVPQSIITPQVGYSYLPYASQYEYVLAPESSVPSAPVNHAPTEVVSSQFHAQDELGQYNYGYSNPNSAKQETKSADGVVKGTYSYIDAYGKMQTVNYISDALGFRAVGTNFPHADEAMLEPIVEYSYLPYAVNHQYY
jgi:hypothetical protein